MDGLTLRIEDGAVLTDDILARVADGEDVQVMRDGELVAKLVGFGHEVPVRDPAAFKAMMERVAANREKLRALGVTYSHEVLRDIRDNLGT